MARKRKLFKHGQEHKRGTLLEFDDTSSDINDFLPGNPAVVAWVLFQAQPGGIFVQSADFTPLKGKWNSIRGSLNIATPRAGVYTLLVVANVDNRPVSFRSEPVRVT